MPHALVDNATPYAFEAHFLLDESGRTLLVPLLKATYALRLGRDPALAEEQAPIEHAGVKWFDAPRSSYKIEPESTSFFKHATDVAVVAHAVAPSAGATRMDVSVRVGSLAKSLRVTGDRSWVEGAAGVVASEPLPFERIPLVWERAFGGWDRTDPDPLKHAVAADNPDGVGFRAEGAAFAPGPLPNIEDPAALLSSYGQTPAPAPAGLGFVGPHFASRARHGGTYDDRWREEKMPRLPSDFNRRFFNAAAPGLRADGYIEGGEDVVISGTRPEGTLAFKLPRPRPPTCRASLRRIGDVAIALRLDTVVIDSDALRLYLLWRGHWGLPESTHDVRWLSFAG